MRLYRARYRGNHPGCLSTGGRISENMSVIKELDKELSKERSENDVENESVETEHVDR